MSRGRDYGETPKQVNVKGSSLVTMLHLRGPSNPPGSGWVGFSLYIDVLLSVVYDVSYIVHLVLYYKENFLCPVSWWKSSYTENTGTRSPEIWKSNLEV